MRPEVAGGGTGTIIVSEYEGMGSDTWYEVGSCGGHVGIVVPGGGMEGYGCPGEELGICGTTALPG